MNFCVYCGQPVDEHAKFCTHCGKPVAKIKTAAPPIAPINQHKSAAISPAENRSQQPKPLKNPGRWIIIAAVAVLTVVFATSFVLLRGVIFGDDLFKARDLGKADFTDPASAFLVETTAYGMIPANQVLILLDEAADRGSAEAIAKSIDAKVAGEIE